MQEISIDEAMQMALRQHQAGQLPEAESVYRQVLAIHPEHPDAMHLLGLLCAATGRIDDAIHLMRRAIAVAPGQAHFYMSLGNVLGSQRRVEEAAECYRAAIERRPDYPEAHNNLGSMLSLIGRFDEALASYRAAIAPRPEYGEAHQNLGLCFMRSGRLPEAVDAFRNTIEVAPSLASAHQNLALTLALLLRVDEALAAIDRAVAIAPANAMAHSFRGELLRRQGRVDEAIEACRKAIELDPNSADVRTNFGNVLMDVDVRQSIEQFRLAVQINPTRSELHSNLLLALHYDANQTPQSIRAEHQAWAQRHAEPLTREAAAHVSPGEHAAEKVLTVGYVSSDFREHPIARFLRPIFESHDRKKFRIACYSDVQSPDEITQEFKSKADVWRDVATMSDAALAKQIGDDGVDILVDLALHTARNRLLVFARNPAPIQITYLAYPGTSGMSAMDYRLTDLHLDPVGNENSYSEKSLRLPRTYWCYSEPLQAPAVGPLPAQTNGFITFGSLNRLAKVGDDCFRAWAKLLASVPESRLKMHARQGKYLARVLQIFKDENVSDDRIIFVPHQSQPDYFATYNKIDIALDPFPCAGGTTSCDALWMGVPLITRAGTLAVHRAGVSLLNNIALSEFIADDDAVYVQAAVDLANDLATLSHLRESLRERMRNGPLMDAAAFTRDLENSFREIWRNWCHFGNKNIST